jgi:hypothetical protein
MRSTYTAADVATALDITPDTLRRTRELRHHRDGLPRPVCLRPLKWERSGFDAWMTRFHPQRPPAPANDPVAPLAPDTIEEHRRLFALEYGSTGS